MVEKGDLFFTLICVALLVLSLNIIKSRKTPRRTFLNSLNRTYERQRLSLCGVNAINNIIGYIFALGGAQLPLVTVEQARKLSADYVGDSGDISEHITSAGWLSMELLTCIFSKTFGEDISNQVKVFANAEWNPEFLVDLYKELDSNKNALMLILGSVGGVGLHWWVAAKSPLWKGRFLVANLDTEQTSWDFINYEEFMEQKINTVHVFSDEVLHSIIRSN